MVLLMFPVEPTARLTGREERAVLVQVLVSFSLKISTEAKATTLADFLLKFWPISLRACLSGLATLS